ncbi:type II toxin-antitoxin system death-on-curing family toxin [Streptomyces roseicoloratus]|uniref:Type II toxin-antitoxin system death-on-curing family toxin n=1 Tax=Streptomyces roseicoloratus TaxID=2508722 RepID=A0ABY9RZ59_9ACTN|nr:type II toxin-antitoxin system death-on-curing family toxin [Streptomyces roseicoloratus]WMX46801.1 type II toxin-antitoxin system death-on-curing family toxin [Streptomyces roseicoloratus]
MSDVRFLTVAEVADIARIAFTGGGVPELRAPGLLESAVHRPRARMFGESAYQDLYEQAAVLLHALASNHPFVDGNKRAAWLSTAVFLSLHEVDLDDVDHDRAYELVVGVASGDLRDIRDIAGRLREL